MQRIKTSQTISDTSSLDLLRDYIAIARPDHWFKNGFMVIGILLAYLFRPEMVWQIDGVRWMVAILATCLVASSNYVINEILDAATDRTHPSKRDRPIASGRVRLSWAYAEWLGLAVVGLGLAATVNLPFAITATVLWVMGLVYNCRPLRTKELPYIDVLSESLNNPLRLALGWFVVISTQIPPMSLLISYWMVGAFFMATKRFAEYRTINDPARAAAYRSSFRHYDDNRLLISMFFYATSAALFLGVFIIRYHLELILCIPLIAGFFACYLKVGLQPNSATQSPERLYRERDLMLFLVLCGGAFLGLMFVHIPALYAWFNVQPSPIPALWTW